MTDKAAVSAPQDLRPVVASPASGRGVWLFAGVMALAALGLFGALEARRGKETSPAVSGSTAPQVGVISAPPQLAIPPDPALLAPAAAFPVQPVAPAAYPPPYAPVRTPPPPRPAAAFSQALPPYSGPIAGQATPAPPAPAYVFQSQPPRPAVVAGPQSAERSLPGRVSAARFSNPATTVPQGAVIQAVLETALDSNRAGFARAVVSQDVYSFDGTRVLVPRGSKLFGDYKADLALGQNRALIQWRRLTRPDGVIIDIDSPSADPLGRAGVKGNVNSHFLTRFGGALLQSVLDVGVQLAARKATGDTIILGLPGSMPQVNTVQPEQVRPTLTVKQGTSVSVFVARDLDFTEVER